MNILALRDEDSLRTRFRLLNAANTVAVMPSVFAVPSNRDHAVQEAPPYLSCSSEKACEVIVADPAPEFEY
jgi:hypothetical protein